MTEQEFRQELDAVVTKGLNNLDAGIVYGQLATIKQFVEVVYDSNIVQYLNRLQANQYQAAVDEAGEDVAVDEAVK